MDTNQISEGQQNSELAALRNRITELEEILSNTVHNNSEQGFRTLLENAPFPVVISSLDGIVLYINSLAENVFRVNRDSAPGRRAADYYADPKDRERMLQELQEKGYVRGLEVKLKNDQGKVFWALLSASPITYGQEPALFAAFGDITDRKLAEEALRNNEELVRNILDNVDESFIVINRDFRIMTANKAYLKATARQSDEIIGRHCHSVSHGLHRPCSEDGEDCTVRGVFRTGMPYSTVHKHRDSEGNVAYVETKAFPLMDSTGEIYAAIETTSNITRRRLLEEEQLKTQKLDAIGTLAGGIAHDFNNLLQGIFGSISLAKLRAEGRKEITDQLQQAEKALTMASGLTSQLLTFSKGGKPVKKLLSLAPTISNSSGFALSGSNCELRLEIDTDLWAVEADEAQIGQVIQNMVLNANQAIDDGGTIRVGADNVVLPAGKMGMAPYGGRFVKISITDSGCGIPDKHIARIFDPYFTTKPAGSGLGLATAYSIIKNHGGAIDVISGPDTGTTFFVYLPAAETPEPTVEIEIPPAGSRSGKILVMDDDRIIRDVAESLMKHLGHEIACARHGEEAIEMYTSAKEAGVPFDIVILDLTIKGGMGGEETIKRLRALDPQVKAIVSTGYSDNPVVAAYRKYGFSACLNKPYNISGLENTLNILLD